jgi:hypothetical protein
MGDGTEVAFLPESELPASANLERSGEFDNDDVSGAGSAAAAGNAKSDDDKLRTLIELGVGQDQAAAALASTGGDLQRAIELFL